MSVEHQVQQTQLCGGLTLLCCVQVQGGLAKAASQLLEDLHRNVRLLSTPERCV